jgi:hypothetical protein
MTRPSLEEMLKAAGAVRSGQLALDSLLCVSGQDQFLFGSVHDAIGF